LNWYDIHARYLPWRIPPDVSRRGVLPDPYHVWLSEVMLQQTQVATVRDYYSKFTSAWPTVKDLASATDDEVMQAWAGLGYYSRARNLKKCAEIVTKEFKGEFPRDVSTLKQLPGIGDYTAAAISAIAFNLPSVVVDGNVERVFARLFQIRDPFPKAKQTIQAKVQENFCNSRPGDFAQACMDLGSLICTPRNPDCVACPLASLCSSAKTGDPEEFPRKAKRKQKPVRKGAAYVIRDTDGAVFLQKRAEKGLLGAMAGVPTTDWSSTKDGGVGIKCAPVPLQWKQSGEIRHTFTHFHLVLEVWLAEAASRPLPEGWWSSPEDLPGEALPTLMKKVLEKAMPGCTRKKG